MLDSVKNLVEFKYRKTIPNNPNPGTFYWVEESDEKIKLFFTTSDKQLIRLDSYVQKLESGDVYLKLVTNPDDSDIKTLSIGYGKYPTVKEDSNGLIVIKPEKYENFEDGVVKVSSSMDFFGTIINKVIYKLNESKYYECGAESNWKTEQVGGISAGLTLNDFSGSNRKTIHQVLDDILFPTLQPELLEDVSIKISLSSKILTDGTIESTKLIKVGTSTAPIKNVPSNYYVANRGKLSYINMNGDNYYAGTFDQSSKTLVFSPSTLPTLTNTEEDIYTVKLKGLFNDGAQPLDNKYKPATSIPKYVSNGNYVESNVLTVYSVYPIYINTENISETKEQSLVNYLTGCTFEVIIPPETDNLTEKFTMCLPNSINSVSVKQYNVVSGKFDINIDMIKVTDTNINTGSYIVYRRTKNQFDTKTDTVKYQITLKKD